MDGPSSAQAGDLIPGLAIIGFNLQSAIDMTYPQLKYANVPLDQADALRSDPDCRQGSDSPCNVLRASVRRPYQSSVREGVFLRGEAVLPGVP